MTSTPATASAPASAPAPPAGFRILLVEDNPVNRVIATKLLEKRGHSVIAVENGALAVEITASESFDLVLMDIQMPVMDGLTATEQIRSREQATGPRLPIVAVTAHALDQDRQRCLAAGMDAHIPKPIRSADLFATIDRLCAAASAAGASA